MGLGDDMAWREAVVGSGVGVDLMIASRRRGRTFQPRIVKRSRLRKYGVLSAVRCVGRAVKLGRVGVRPVAQTDERAAERRTQRLYSYKGPQE